MKNKDTRKSTAQSKIGEKKSLKKEKDWNDHEMGIRFEGGVVRRRV